MCQVSTELGAQLPDAVALILSRFISLFQSLQYLPRALSAVLGNFDFRLPATCNAADRHRA